MERIKNSQLPYIKDILKKKNLSLISINDDKGFSRGKVLVKCEICSNLFDISGERFCKSRNPETLIKCKNCEFTSKLNHCIKVAKQYTLRSLFAKESPYEYGFLMRNEKLNEACSHMVAIGNKECRLIYVYIFDLNGFRYAYVGLTYNLEKRHKMHCEKGSVYKFSKKYNIPIPLPIVLTPYLPKEEAAIKEGEYAIKYKNEGYILINQKGTGGLGGNTRFDEYTIDNLKNIVSQYKNRSEWKKNDYPSYYYAYSRNIIDDIMAPTANIGNKKYYTYERCKEIISGLPSDWSIKDFETYNPSLYVIICRNKWNELLGHFERKMKFTNLTLEIVKNTLNQCVSITEFSEKFPKMRDWCYRNNIKISKLVTNKHLNKSQLIIQKISKPILCFDKNGNFIKRYKNAREAVIDGFSYKKISSCCNGKNKTHKGFIFIFEKDYQNS